MLILRHSTINHSILPHLSCEDCRFNNIWHLKRLMFVSILMTCCKSFNLKDALAKIKIIYHSDMLWPDSAGFFCGKSMGFLPPWEVLPKMCPWQFLNSSTPQRWEIHSTEVCVCVCWRPVKETLMVNTLMETNIIAPWKMSFLLGWLPGRCYVC